MTNHYESSGTPPPPAYLRDVFNKCTECGETWVGTRRDKCSKCVAEERGTFAGFIISPAPTQ